MTERWKPLKDNILQVLDIQRYTYSVNQKSYSKVHQMNSRLILDVLHCKLQLVHGLKQSLANQAMVSNFSFGLVAFSEVNGILVLLAQTIVSFPLYPIILELVRTQFESKALLYIISNKFGHVLITTTKNRTIMLPVCCCLMFLQQSLVCGCDSDAQAW